MQIEIVDKMAELAEIEPSRILPEATLASLGFDSIMLLELVAYLEQQFGLEIPELAIWSAERVQDLLRLVPAQI